MKPPQAKRAFDLVSYAMEKIGLSKDRDVAYALRILETKARNAVGRAPKLAKRKAVRKLLRSAGVTPKTKSDWLKEADMWFSRFIRLRDSEWIGDELFCSCVTCGKVYPLKEIENGHWIPRENHGTRFNEKNCHCQGACCNKWRKGAEPEHEKAIAQKYGAHVPGNLKVIAEIQKRRKTSGELEQIAKHYETKVVEMGGWPKNNL